MERDINELEQILDGEIDAYSRLEKCVMDKKDILIKGDMDALRKIDAQLENHIVLVSKLEKQRQIVISRIGCGTSTLRDIIDGVNNKESASSLDKKLLNLKDLVFNVKRYNDINAELIKHSLKLIEHSVVSIANVLMPESSSYNGKGRAKTDRKNQNISISSVNAEA